MANGVVSLRSVMLLDKFVGLGKVFHASIEHVDIVRDLVEFGHVLHVLKFGGVESRSGSYDGSEGK